MKKIKHFTIVLLLTGFNFNATAQNAGDNDPTFNPTDVGFDFGTGANGNVETTAIQSDGKIIIGGDFTSYNGTTRKCIARLNTNGSLDTSIIGTGANGNVNTIAIQSDGKIIIGGNFTSYNGTLINRIARLNIDGSLDTSFVVGTGANSYVYATAIQSDGKIIIGGAFTSYNGTLINSIARLNTDGSLDTSFVVGTGANSYVYATAIQSDGKIIIGGNFTSYNGTLINYIARLNTDGGLDNLFVVGTGANSYVRTTILQADGKIIIGGYFTSYNGTLINCIARLNTNGSLDTSFVVGTGANNGIVSTTAIQSDGKIIIGGNFISYNGTPRNCIARLSTNGSLDTSFVIGTGVYGSFSVIRTTAIQSDGKIIIGGGGFSHYNGTLKKWLARIHTDGSLDPSFVVGTAANNNVQTTAIQSDGKIIIGGGFTSYNGALRNSIARLNTDGSIDTLFIIGTGTTGTFSYVSTTAIQSDGKIIIGGSFTSYNGTPRKSIARLNTNGSLDTSFVVGTGATGIVYTTAIQPDGKIIIGGNFLSYNGTLIESIARLNTDGRVDTSFVVGTGANGPVSTTGIQPDGKIIIGGNFTSYNGTLIKSIARLNTDGSLDTSFVVGTGANNYVLTTTLQPDGKIIIGGEFTTYNGVSRNKIARLNADGTIDTTFNVGTVVINYVSTTAILSDGKIIIGGNFISYNGTPRNGIARLNTDGSLDTSFVVGTGVNNGSVYTVAIQPDGKIIIGGDFTSYNGTGRNRIARLFNNCYSSKIDTQTACDSLTWIDGITYTLSTNTPTFTIVNGATNGCDSVITLNLTINATSSIDSIVACDSITWIDGNTYTVSTNTPTYTLTNTAGCDSIVTLNLTINAPYASYSSIDNTNGNYSFTNTSTGNFNQTHWAFGDGATSTATNPHHTFSANGTYVVVLTVNDSTSSSCMGYYLDTIVVTGVVAPLQCAAGFVMYPDAGGVTVVNSSTGTNLTYLWDFGDGDTSNAQFPSHTYATTGNYYLCLTIDDGAGCVDMYCDSIGENGVVFNKQTGFTINVIAPPLVTQVNEQAAITSAMSVYPNPTGKKLNVVFNKNEPYQLKIVAIDGKLIETKTIVGNTTLDVSNYSTGMYFITATNNEGKVYQSKFVKE